MDTLKTKDFRVSDSHRVNRLNHKITNDKKNNRLPYTEYSFLKIVANAFDLSPNIEEHMTFVLLNLKNDYHMLCNCSTIENMVLASAIYAMECSELPCYEDTDISGFVQYLYKPEAVREEMTKIYELYLNLQEIFRDSDKQVLPRVANHNPYTVSF